MVEYLHTGNLVDMLSSNPWGAVPEEEAYVTGNNDGDGWNPLLSSPPEDFSVSLYLESDPTKTLIVVAVPR